MNQRTILRTILAIVLLCGTAYGAMAAWDDTKGTGDALTAAEWNAMVTYLNGIAPGSGDMLKSTYDPNTDGVIAVAQGGTGVTGDTYDADKVDGSDAGMAENNVFKIHDFITDYGVFYKSPSPNGIAALFPDTDGYQLTTHGTGAAPSWEPAGGGSGDMLKSTYDPNTDGVIAVAQGGTGVTGDTYDADKVDGSDAGMAENNVFKIHDFITDYGVFYKSPSPNGIAALFPDTDGYQLTTHGTGAAPSWAAASDLIFSDTHCPKCGKKFEDGDDLILHVIGHNEVGDILTIPMHLSCAEAPKKAVTVKRKVVEDRLIFDETTGETRVQRVQKMQTKTITKYRLKEGYSVDSVTGNFERHNASIPEPTPKTFLTTLKELVIKPKAVEDTESVTKSEAVEGYEAESREVVYEDYEVVI